MLSAFALGQTAIVPPTALGLTSNFNYYFTNGGKSIPNLSVQIDLENDLKMAERGVSFQVNTWPRNASAPAGVASWLQFIIGFQPASPHDNNDFGWLFATIQMWDTAFRQVGSEFLTLGYIDGLTFLAGSQFNISVINDKYGKPTGAKFSFLVLGDSSRTESSQTFRLNNASRAVSLPFNLFTFNIVSYGDSLKSNLSTGSGTIRYSIPVPFHPISWGPRSPITETAETSNVAYSLMTNESGTVLQQKWVVLAKDQTIVNPSDFTGPYEQKRRV